ncbi:MAG TPA: peptidase M48 [Bacteroidales bacterium]|jgi:predicted Zn-dependent protease|nr:peptidase M48 [Bacteroidales bacterium]
MKRIVKVTLILLGVILITSNCDEDRGFVWMPIGQEKMLGLQLDSTIKASPSDFPILDRDQYSQVYAFMDEIFYDILNNSKEPLKYKSEFQWKLTIIEKDELNAFAAPGGYLYFYTGLLKYLDKTSEVAGVLGHEMAHADLRHSARQMQKAYGLNFAASILFGDDKSQLEQILIDIGSGLAALQFSRTDEYQSDEFSVKYLAGTAPVTAGYDCKYDPRGVAGFFQKLEEAGASEPLEILSTHPSGENRVEEVEAIWESLGSPQGESFETEYAAFKALLP